MKMEKFKQRLRDVSIETEFQIMANSLIDVLMRGDEREELEKLFRTFFMYGAIAANNRWSLLFASEGEEEGEINEAMINRMEQHLKEFNASMKGTAMKGDGSPATDH